MRDLIVLYEFMVRIWRNFKKWNIFDILRSISDDKSLTIFNTIALSNGSATIAISRLKLTRKQYYSRMSAMTNAGLITRRNGKFFLTSFGKVVYQAHILIGKAQQNYWKLKAVDAIESSNDGLATEDRNNFINNLIMDSDLKQILLSGDETKDNSRKLIALQQT
jgi:hypothetical protein